MVGKDCVAIACDLRLGTQALTVSNNHAKIFGYGDGVYLGATGLATDVATVRDSVEDVYTGGIVNGVTSGLGSGVSGLLGGGKS